MKSIPPQRYVVAAIRPWNLSIFHARIANISGKWHLIENREDLTIERVAEINPRLVFVMHWSWRIEAAILDGFECIGFHPSALPFGRGGSPIQNLISRGHRDTVLTAFRVVQEMDSGPIYFQRPMSLEGTAEEIFVRMANLAADMIEALVADTQKPQAQSGEPVVFTRRTPEQSAIPEDAGLSALFDHIRMLDAAEYPRAFLETGGLRFEFRNPVLRYGNIEARVEITERRDD